MHKTIMAATAATALAVGLLSTTAAATTPTPNSQAGAASISASRHHVFNVRPGKIFVVTDSVRGVRRGDRLALESGYRHRWHQVGSWPMRRGQRHFTGRTYGTTPGLFTLRLQFVRHHHWLKGSQSNRFYVRVDRFRIKNLRRPHTHGTPAALPGTVNGPATRSQVLNWQEPIQCAPSGAAAGFDDTVGHGILVTPPTANIGLTGPVAQAIWVQAAQPGGNFGPWQLAAQPVEEDLTTPQPDTFSLGTGNDTTVSNQLGSHLLFYPNDSGDMFRNIAWDLEIPDGNGGWAWISNTWYTPAKYRQYTRDGLSSFTSQFCETYNS